MENYHKIEKIGEGEQSLSCIDTFPGSLASSLGPRYYQDAFR